MSKWYWISLSIGVWVLVDAVGYAAISLINLSPLRSSISPLLFLGIMQPMLFLYYRNLVKEKLKDEEYI